MNKRELALAWWRILSPDEQDRIIKQHFPNTNPILIKTSSSKIQQIFEKECSLS